MKKNRGIGLKDVDRHLRIAKNMATTILADLDKPVLTRRDVSRLKSLQKKLADATVGFDEYRLVIANRLAKRFKTSDKPLDNDKRKPMRCG